MAWEKCLNPTYFDKKLYIQVGSGMYIKLLFILSGLNIFMTVAFLLPYAAYVKGWFDYLMV